MKLDLLNRELSVRNIPCHRKNVSLEDKKSILENHMKNNKELELKKVVTLSKEQRKQERKDEKIRKQTGIKNEKK